MSVGDLMTQTVSLERTTSITRDELGAAEPASGTSTSVQAYVEPRTSEEDENTRASQLGEWRAFLPAGTDVTGWDRLVYGARTFDIVGPPRPVYNPRAASESHVELDLKERF